MSSAVPVTMHGFTWGSGLLVILNLLVGGGIIKAWPALKKIAADRELAISQGRREDMDDMRKRITDLESKVEAASQAAHSAEMKLVFAVSAVQLLAARIRANNPDDPTLKQAMELLAAATTGDLPSWGKKLSDGINRRREEEV